MNIGLIVAVIMAPCHYVVDLVFHILAAPLLDDALDRCYVLSRNQSGKGGDCDDFPANSTMQKLHSPTRGSIPKSRTEIADTRLNSISPPTSEAKETLHKMTERNLHIRVSESIRLHRKQAVAAAENHLLLGSDFTAVNRHRSDTQFTSDAGADIERGEWQHGHATASVRMVSPMPSFSGRAPAIPIAATPKEEIALHLNGFLTDFTHQRNAVSGAALVDFDRRWG